MRKPTIVPSINYGQMIQTAMFLITVATFVWFQAGFQARTEQRLAASEARSAEYRPKVDELLKSDAIQNDRIGAQSDSIRAIRETNTDILSKISDISADLATVKTTVQLKLK